MKKANPKAVGGFVIVAVILLITAVAVFGGGQFFRKHERLVAFFPGSLMGLRLGASVDMRGIQLGTVTDLWIEFDPESNEFILPVVMEIDLSRIHGVTESQDAKGNLDELIAKGFRARLVAQSLVTGQQSIQFGFHPDTPVKMVETDLPYDQVPTIPSTFETVQGSIEEVAKRANTVLAQISDVLSVENRARVNQTLKNVAVASEELDGTVKSIRVVFDDLGVVTAKMRDDAPELKRLRQTAQTTLESYDALAKRMDGILAKNEKGISDFANTGLYEITNLAVDLQATAEQIRRVVEEMERDPARYFLGRPREVDVQ